jgi:hypothetical protein
MVLSYMHILKKIYLKNYVTAESDGWLLGGYAFFLISLHYCFRNFSKCYTFKWFNFNYHCKYFLIRFEFYLQDLLHYLY